jgi:hypothetical protein
MSGNYKKRWRNYKTLASTSFMLPEWGAIELIKSQRIPTKVSDPWKKKMSLKLLWSNMSSSYHSAHENNHDHALSSGRVMNRFAITHALDLGARD